MAVVTLLLGAALTLGAGVLFATVGALTLRREARGEARGAIRGFAAWWLGAAIVLSLSGVGTLLGLAGVLDPAVHTALLHLRAVPISIGAFGLLYYLLYLYTGTTRWRLPLAAFYAVQFAFTIYYFQSLAPLRVEPTAWEIRIASTGTPDAAVSVAFGVLLAAPVLAAAAAYASLLRYLTDRTHRFRVGVVSLAFFQWFGAILVGFLAGWTTREWFFLVYTVPGLLAAVLVLVAYRPPRLVRDRLRVEPVPQRAS